MCVAPEKAETILKVIKATKYGADAEIIGEVKADRPGMVLMKTQIGGTRILRKPIGEPIPRVC
jgi:hydrogenase expression/formation protein HypE